MNPVSNPVTLIVADDHNHRKKGFGTMFKNVAHLKFVAATVNGQELLAAVKAHPPQIVIIDIEMPVLNGIEATRLIKAEHPEIKVIGISGCNEHSVIMDMINAGAEGYLLKNAPVQELIDAIETVLDGERYLCRETSEKLTDRVVAYLSRRANSNALTEREIEIIKLIAQEKTSNEISNKLGITLRTVESHRHHIQKKIGVNSIAGIVVYAMKNGYA